MICNRCGEEILDGQRCGHIQGGDFHHECATAMVVGSIGHQLGLCSCNGGPGIYDDPPGVSVRDAAKIAMRFFLARQVLAKIPPEKRDPYGFAHEFAVVRSFEGIVPAPDPFDSRRLADELEKLYGPNGAGPVPEITREEPLFPSIVCPKCKRRSFNPNDVQNRYCGACHEYHDAMNFLPKSEDASGDRL